MRLGELYRRAVATAGVGTVVCMHLSEGHLKKATESHVNVVVAGHIASDNLGLNLLLDAVIGDEEVAVHGCSGFERVERPRTP